MTNYLTEFFDTRPIPVIEEIQQPIIGRTWVPDDPEAEIDEGNLDTGHWEYFDTGETETIQVESWPEFYSVPVWVPYDAGGGHWEILSTEEQYIARQADVKEGKLFKDLDKAYKRADKSAWHLFGKDVNDKLKEDKDK